MRDSKALMVIWIGRVCHHVHHFQFFSRISPVINCVGNSMYPIQFEKLVGPQSTKNDKLSFSNAFNWLNITLKILWKMLTYIFPQRKGQSK